MVGFAAAAAAWRRTVNAGRCQAGAGVVEPTIYWERVAAERFAARRLKRSTRPPVSTSFWRPV
jgi:hypothetical protein